MTEIYLIKILFLSAVQGMSEFIPVSSSGLLIIFENILEIKNNNLLINATMHGGSLAAVIVFFYKDLLGLWKNHLLLINLIIATLPVVVLDAIQIFLSHNKCLILALPDQETIKRRYLQC